MATEGGGGGTLCGGDAANAAPFICGRSADRLWWWGATEGGRGGTLCVSAAANAVPLVWFGLCSPGVADSLLLVLLQMEHRWKGAHSVGVVVSNLMSIWAPRKPVIVYTQIGATSSKLRHEYRKRVHRSLTLFTS